MLQSVRGCEPYWPRKGIRTCFAGAPAQSNLVGFAVRIVPLEAIPVLTPVIGIALAIVVDDEVVLVQAFAYKLLVAILINLVENIIDLVNLIVVKGLLARLAQGAQFCKPSLVVDLWHGEEGTFNRWSGS